ncbi:MAG: nucleotide exchange factor GrpE [Rickettsiales bacterium]|jgi:molecular chaperone GrpE|nr:nucleotide exchange factor GrpE [Rickettsiales bacterium]
MVVEKPHGKSEARDEPEFEPEKEENEEAELGDSEEESSSEELEELDRLLKENADLKDKLLRTLAELENTRRRAAEEKDRTVKFAIADFVKDLIAVMENFHLALANIGKGAEEESFRVFHSGIELTFSELKKVFDKNNVSRIYPLGEQFNPRYHEAIATIESNSTTGIIVEVMQAGYALNDRILKPALVVVAK